MTKTINISEMKNSIQAVIALTRGGDEVVLEENGRPLIKVIPMKETNMEREFLAWETASDEDFLKFEEEFAETK